MPKREWSVEINAAAHRIAMEKGMIVTSTPRVTVDEKPVEVTVARQPGVIDREGIWRFTCDGVECAIHMRPGWWTMGFDLEVAGASVETGKKIESSAPMPGWAYVFVVPCFLLVALGGALPAGLGVGGAMGCAAVAKNGNQPVWLRALICAIITAGCWITVLAIGVAITMARSG